VRQREFETLRLESEDVAEFLCRPRNWGRVRRLVVVRKNISRQEGEGFC
jgi:hypothetical protein